MPTVHHVRLAPAARTFFTHIAHELAHAQTEAELPPNMFMAHDGLELVSE
ncbi:MAG: hypothetical protein AMXMBFR47_13500 [Planctomycetota bacterium]